MPDSWMRSIKKLAPRSRAARDKILSVEQLAAVAAEARRANKLIVLAHGAFDLLHLGHVRHLELARQQGDILFVTVTGDRFINKGPGRPVFTASLRAEMLAALSCVDWVGVNEAPTAVEPLNAIRPDVYVKGSDYAEANEDITGKIAEERQTVEAYGGRIHFTDDIVFSSSSLLNRHFDLSDPGVRAYLQEVRERDVRGRLMQMIEEMSRMRVLLVGDTIIDEYQYVHPLNKSPKENLIPTLYREREVFAGGVIAAANHVAGFCREVEVLTCLGEADRHNALVQKALKPNVRLTALQRHGVPTTRKCRYIDSDYFRKLFEVHFMEDTPVGGDLEASLIEHIERLAPAFDVVIVTDFGHGLIGREATSALTSASRFLAINAQTNSSNLGFNLVTRYPRADYVCVDAPEARLAVGDRIGDIGEIISRELPARIKCGRFIVTHGRYGCVTFDDATGQVHRIPAFSGQATDTMGAGDAFLAVTSPLVAAGGDMELIGFIGNAVGAMKIGIIGHRQSVEKIPLLKYLTALLK
jgi:rfaE bifunctional protein nucleotidyltransferase chain/domain